MANILIISGHPNLTNSTANKFILDGIQNFATAKNLNYEIRDLGKLYPNFAINVKDEQQALLKADIVIFQYPLFWYGVPAILKHWFDEVMQFDFAYGDNGSKLQGKKAIFSFTVGVGKNEYPIGKNKFAMENFMSQYEQTIEFIEMEYLTAIYSFDMAYIPNELNTLEGVQTRANKHIQNLIQEIEKNLK